MDWNNATDHEQYPLHQIHQNGGGGDGGGGLYVKVMTDEQVEVLRRQISVYATICEQLVDMHKALTSPHDLAGIRLGNPYCDPSMTYAGNSISARHRWTPTAVQLQVLERIFDEGSGTPSKEKIKDITSNLAQHGQISETNVYNWFQNRRARSKRKQGVATPNNAESEVETSKENKMKQESPRSHGDGMQRADDVDSKNPEMSAKMHCLDTQASVSDLPSDDNLKSSASLGSLAWYGSFLRVDQFLMDKMEIPGSLSPSQEGEEHDGS